jgi:hypothetical protein
MGERPSPDHTPDRIDGRKGYTPANTRWATRTQQARNVCSNQLILFRGRVLCRAAWADEYGLRPGTVGNRLARGWSVKQALTASIGKSKAAQPRKKSKRPKARASRATAPRGRATGVFTA